MTKLFRIQRAPVLYEWHFSVYARILIGGVAYKVSYSLSTCWQLVRT